MISNQKHRYDVKEIEEMFQIVRKQNRITKREYELFCFGISFLPVDVVEEIKNKIYFVILSSHRKKGGPACFVNRKDLNEKSVIVIAPSFFKYNVRPCLFEAKITQDISTVINNQCREILHEVAHYKKDHRDTSDYRKRKMHENEADELAENWLMKSAK